jgi:hypothetical protein
MSIFRNRIQKPKKKAIQLTNEYNKDLALSGEQQVLFQKKVEEFLIRRRKIEKEFTGKEKLEMLTEMQQRETEEMHDILTEPQMVYYKKAKPKLQPLDTVNKTEKK